MNAAFASRALPIALAAIAVLLLANWLIMAAIPPAVERREPLPDQSAAVEQAKVDFSGFFKNGEGKPGQLQGAWPWFRGPKLDGIATDETPLSRKWAGAGPARVWEVQTGEGYAGAAVADGRVYFLDYDEEKRADVLRCLSADDGKEIWQRGYQIDIGRNHGISRTVCAVAGGRVVALGPKCHVMCADAGTGEFKWGIDLVREHGSVVPQWYAGQNPLIDDGKVILGVGGKKSLVMAVKLDTGEIAWQTPNDLRWQMTHSSIASMMFQGRKIYLYSADKGVVGVSAADGKLLFALPDWQVPMANVPTPLPLPDDRVLLCGGYGAGAMMIKLEETAGAVKARVLFKLLPEEFGSEQHTPIFHKGQLYGVRQADKQVVCLDLNGKQLWQTSGKFKYGSGPYLIADGLILVVNDTGTLTLIEAVPEKCTVVAQGRIFDHGHESWGPMALVRGRLFARDMNRLACFDLRKVTP